MKRIKLILALYFIAILLHFVGLAYFIGQREFLFTQILIAFSALLFIIRTFKLLNKFQSELSRFLFAIKYRDFDLHFSEEHAYFPDLSRAIQKNLDELKSLNQQEESKFHEIESIISLLELPIILIKNDQELAYTNANANNQFPFLKTLSSDIKGGLSEKIKEKIAIEEKRLSNLDIDFKEQHFTLENTPYTLLSFRSFANATEEIESDAWSNLMQVLAHEVMNSIGTISSLAKTVHNELSNTSIDSRLIEALERIQARSNHLISFTDSYRKIDQARFPQQNWFSLNQCIQKEIDAFKNAHNSIQLALDGSFEFKIYADESQISQVILNCFLNAKEALKDTKNAFIKCTLEEDSRYYRLLIQNNGIAIPQSEKNKIFIPFYSTKEKGSGIGLSLSRKLMYLNQAKISLLHSEPGNTTFQLLFPKSH